MDSKERLTNRLRDLFLSASGNKAGERTELTGLQVVTGFVKAVPSKLPDGGDNEVFDGVPLLYQVAAFGRLVSAKVVPYAAKKEGRVCAPNINIGSAVSLLLPAKGDAWILSWADNEAYTISAPDVVVKGADIQLNGEGGTDFKGLLIAKEVHTHIKALITEFNKLLTALTTMAGTLTAATVETQAAMAGTALTSALTPIVTKIATLLVKTEGSLTNTEITHKGTKGV